MPTPSDQLRALDYLGKIYGDYAITKTETELKFNKVSDVQDWILSKNK
jgi:hypothetical protein